MNSACHRVTFLSIRWVLIRSSETLGEYWDLLFSAKCNECIGSSNNRTVTEQEWQQWQRQQQQQQQPRQRQPQQQRQRQQQQRQRQQQQRRRRQRQQQQQRQRQQQQTNQPTNQPNNQTTTTTNNNNNSNNKHRHQQQKTARRTTTAQQGERNIPNIINCSRVSSWPSVRVVDLCGSNTPEQPQIWKDHMAAARRESSDVVERPSHV